MRNCLPHYEVVDPSVCSVCLHVDVGDLVTLPPPKKMVKNVRLFRQKVRCMLKKKCKSFKEIAARTYDFCSFPLGII